MAHVSVSRLESLLESAQLLHASLDLDNLLKHLLRTVMGRLLVTRAVIAIDAGDGLRVAMARGVVEAPVGSPFDAARAHALGLPQHMPIGTAPAVGLLATAVPARPAVDEEERAFLEALLGIAATGISNANAHTQATRLNRDLDRKIQELRTLMELGRAFSRVSEVEEVARIFGLTIAGQWMVTRYAIAVCRDTFGTVSRQQGVKLPPLSTYMDALHHLPEASLVDDLEDDRPAHAVPGPQAAGRCSRCAAASRCVASRRSGRVRAGRRTCRPTSSSVRGWPRRPWSRSTTAGTCARCWTRSSTRRSWPSRPASSRGSSRRRCPTSPGFDVAAMNRPAQQVGGDYYDVLTLTDVGGDACLFCVADVSGKGLAASLLMSTIQATLRALLGREASLADLARRTNELLFATTPGSKYATAALVLAYPDTGECRYVSGGHTETLLLRASGERIWMGATGVPLGLFPGMTWEELSFTLDSGDVLVLYSDGVSEAQTVVYDEFGPDRLADIVERQRDRPAAQIIDSIVASIDAFVEGAPQFDDITLMVIRRT